MSRILVIGLGGIGGVVSAGLIKHGHHVFGISSNPKILEQLKSDGFTFVENQSEWSVPASVSSAPSVGQTFDYILLATQPPQVEQAAQSAFPFLSDDGVFVCFQNGLIESRMAKTYGAEKVVGAIISWGASMIRPAVYEKTSKGGFTLGRLQGPPDEKVLVLAKMFEAIGPVSLTENLLGARFSKLAINCAISTLGTIAGQRLGVLLRHRHIRRLAIEIMSEVEAVARAEQVELTKLSGTIDLAWLALTEKEQTQRGSLNLFLKHLVLWAVGFKFRRLRSSMLQAIERGRPPAVDFLNGEIIQRAKKHGISVPINTAAHAEVHAIAKGEHPPAMSNLMRIFEVTRCVDR